MVHLDHRPTQRTQLTNIQLAHTQRTRTKPRQTSFSAKLRYREEPLRVLCYTALVPTLQPILDVLGDTTNWVQHYRVLQ